MSTKHSKKVAPQKKPGMPVWLPLIIVAGLVLIVVAVMSGNNTPAAKPAVEVSGAPALKADKESVDFGDVKLGQTVEVKFEVANVGSRPLLFKETPYVEVVEGC